MHNKKMYFVLFTRQIPLESTLLISKHPKQFFPKNHLIESIIIDIYFLQTIHCIVTSNEFISAFRL